MRKGKKKQTTYWIMLLPAILFFAAFAYLPMFGVYMAFTRYDYSLGIFKSPFVGLRNFQYLFKGGFQSVAWRLTQNTLLYNLAFIFLGNLLQVFVSIILKEVVGAKVRKISQAIMFLPYFISYAIVGVVAYNILGSYGVINHFRDMVGADAIRFYQKPGMWPVIIVLFQLWKELGYGTVIYFSALSGIDETIYEAACIDGSSRLQRIRYITLPMLRPTVIVLLLFSFGKILKGQFELFYNLIGNNGGLYAVTDIIDTYVYRAIAVSPNLGLGSAAGFYQSAFGLILVLLVNQLVKKIEPDYGLF